MTRLDVEWLAFRAGLKPTIRRTAPPERAEEVRSRLAREAVVLRAEATAWLGAREVVVLYAARSAEDAVALRDAEFPVLPGRVTAVDVAAAHRAVGLALGFPGCCVEAFCARVSRGVDRLKEGGPGGLAEDYVAARAAWVRAPDARINPLLMRTGAQLVSFYPCRFDCGAAVAQAEALRSLLAAEDPAAARSLMSTLARAVIIGSDGARAQVLCDGAGCVTRAVAPTREGEAIPGDVRFAEGLRGACVDAHGAVLGPPLLRGEPPWCVRFDALP